MILEISAALELDRPVVMGCSIGGGGGVFFRPDVHGGEVCAGVVSGLISPTAPEAERWETLWHYMQSGPGVFKGDLHFYKVDGDIRGRVAQIDTKRCPLFLLSGEYDYSCTPEETRAVGRSIPGAEVTIMNGLGNFP